MVQSLTNFYKDKSVEAVDIVIDSIRMEDYPFFNKDHLKGITTESSNDRKEKWILGLLKDEGLDDVYHVEYKGDEMFIATDGVYAAGPHHQDFPNCVRKYRYVVYFDGDEISQDNLFRDGYIVKPTEILNVLDTRWFDDLVKKAKKARNKAVMIDIVNTLTSRYYHVAKREGIGIVFEADGVNANPECSTIATYTITFTGTNLGPNVANDGVVIWPTNVLSVEGPGDEILHVKALNKQINKYYPVIKHDKKISR